MAIPSKQWENSFHSSKPSVAAIKDHQQLDFVFAHMHAVVQYISTPNQAALIFLDNQINLFTTDVINCKKRT
ncbi:MAG: hypothetical protein HY860_04490 [Chlamydiales bacterium]|nr:hypothetical protein [Chlamydiales bacterium]